MQLTESTLSNTLADVGGNTDIINQADITKQGLQGEENKTINRMTTG